MKLDRRFMFMQHYTWLNYVKMRVATLYILYKQKTSPSEYYLVEQDRIIFPSSEIIGFFISFAGCDQSLPGCLFILVRSSLCNAFFLPANIRYQESEQAKPCFLPYNDAYLLEKCLDGFTLLYTIQHSKLGCSFIGEKKKSKLFIFSNV